MSKKFFAVHRDTGKRWTPPAAKSGTKDLLVLLDSGALAVASTDGFYQYLNMLGPEWLPVIKGSLKESADHNLLRHGRRDHIKEAG